MGQLFQLCLLILLPASYSCQPENSRAPRNPLPSVGPFISTQRSLDAIKIDPSGKAYTTQISKQQLANELDLPLRDLRIVDPSYPSQIMATFTARKNAILFCIENIKVVVQHDEALVFGPLQPEVSTVQSTSSFIANCTHHDSNLACRCKNLFLRCKRK